MITLIFTSNCMKENIQYVAKSIALQFQAKQVFPKYICIIYLKKKGDTVFCIGFLSFCDYNGSYEMKMYKLGGNDFEVQNISGYNTREINEKL